MQLAGAPRVAHGRCAPLADTVERLETGLRHVCPFEYREERVADSLYRGALVSDALGFSPMGKGRTKLHCKVSTLAEAAEWLSLRRRRALPGHIESHQNGIPDPLPIEDLLSHVASVTPQTLAAIKETEHARHWVTGHSLRDGRALSVPLEYVNAISGTNGVAAGNCIEEAIVQAACEIIERRTVITVVKNRMGVPTLRPDSIDDPVLREQIAFFRDNDVELYVKDFSFGGQLPCIGVYFVNHALPSALQAHGVVKAAASYDREAALGSALAEYAQVCRPGPSRTESLHEYERLLCGGEDCDNFLPLFWFGYLPHADARYLAEGETVPFERGEKLGDCLEDIGRIKELCRGLKKDFVVVDLTDPAIGFPVVQVVIPGYSDILPYHPKSSSVLFEGWRRDTVMGEYQTPCGPRPCTAERLFPDW